VPPFEYHNDAEKTRAAYDAHGRATIGDIGWMDEQGYLYLTDRRSHMIISGGVNIYPQEAENLLATHPGVADVAVFGVPNAEFGEEVKAVVVATNALEATPAFAAELIDFCRARLSHVKCPRSLDFAQSLPRSETGKLLKRLLKDAYAN
jgi:acyl-CoA synthetase (AMP-forming)/AMP-acid ligase II